MCKILILQDNWCKKWARFLACKISSAKNLHILKEMCEMAPDFLTWVNYMEGQCFLKKIKNSDWAIPIVAVTKKEGKFRTCSDYKVTVNDVLAFN